MTSDICFCVKKEVGNYEKINLCGEFPLILNYLKILTKHGKKKKKEALVNTLVSKITVLFSSFFIKSPKAYNL